MSPRVRLAAAWAFNRSAMTLLIAIIAGLGSAVAGVAVSVVGLLLGARRIRRVVAMHRADRAAMRRRNEIKLVWDEKWDRWGGRLPAKQAV